MISSEKDEPLPCCIPTIQTDSPLTDLAEGATKGAIKGFWEISKTEIKELAKKLKDRGLAFIEDREIIDLVKEQRKSEELKLFLRYVENPNMYNRSLFQMGLTLRKMEDEEKKLRPFKDKIVKKYGPMDFILPSLYRMNYFLNI